MFPLTWRGTEHFIPSIALRAFTWYKWLVLHEVFSPAAALCAGGTALTRSHEVGLNESFLLHRPRCLPQLYLLLRCTTIKAVGQLHSGIGGPSSHPSSPPWPAHAWHQASSSSRPSPAASPLTLLPCPPPAPSAAPACLAAGFLKEMLQPRSAPSIQLLVLLLCISFCSAQGATPNH